MIKLGFRLLIVAAAAALFLFFFEVRLDDGRIVVLRRQEAERERIRERIGGLGEAGSEADAPREGAPPPPVRRQKDPAARSDPEGRIPEEDRRALEEILEEEQSQ